MTTKEVCGVELVDGPLGPWKNAYPMDWPLPEVLIAFKVRGQVAITTVEYEAAAKKASQDREAYRYRKVRESQLDDEAIEKLNNNVMRGAVYEIVE